MKMFKISNLGTKILFSSEKKARKLINESPNIAGGSEIFQRKALPDQILPKNSELLAWLVSCPLFLSFRILLRTYLLKNICNLLILAQCSIPIHPENFQGVQRWNMQLKWVTFLEIYLKKVLKSLHAMSRACNVTQQCNFFKFDF